MVYRGFYPGETLTEWIETLLATKLQSPTRVMFSQLPSRVTVYASQRERRALCFDSHKNPEMAPAYAVRCSMSIPYYFIPESDQGYRAYDGGLQYNYPVEEFLRDNPTKSFIGLYLGSAIYKHVHERWVFADLYAIWTESHDPEALAKYKDKTVIIDTCPIETLDFALTEDEKKYLVECGRAAALQFILQKKDAYEAAKQSRDVLKARIEKARNARKEARRRNRRLDAIGVIALVLFSFFGRWWLSAIPIYRGSMSSYLDLRDDAGPAGSVGRATFFKENAPRRVRWEGLIIEKVTDGYKIQPNDKDTRHVLVLAGDQYVSSIPVGKYISFTAIVRDDVPIGVLWLTAVCEPKMIEAPQSVRK